MTVPLYVVAIVILLILSSYFSATETAFSSLNKIKIKSLATSNSKKSRLVAKLCNDYDSLISTILVGNNIVNIVLTTLFAIRQDYGRQLASAYRFDYRYYGGGFDFW